MKEPLVPCRPAGHGGCPEGRGLQTGSSFNSLLTPCLCSSLWTPAAQLPTPQLPGCPSLAPRAPRCTPTGPARPHRRCARMEYPTHSAPSPPPCSFAKSLVFAQNSDGGCGLGLRRGNIPELRKA